MPPRRRFDKKNAKTFSVVHRAHDDAQFYDDEASAHVLVEAPTNANKSDLNAVKQVQGAPKKKIYTIEELEKTLNKEEIQALRDNEGMAAQYGIFFDDSKYDYMQHLKPIGQDNEGIFIEAKSDKKAVQKSSNIEDLFKGQLPSEHKRKINNELNQSIPDELKGFKPNMDPRLREVLEALEDEAYITEDEDGEGKDGEEDIFTSLLQSGEVEDEEEFYGSDYDGYDDEYDEWDMDNYEDEYNDKYNSDNYEDAEVLYNAGEAPAELDTSTALKVDASWRNDFSKFKAETGNKANEWDSDDDFDEEEEDNKEEEEEENDVVGELPTGEVLSKSSKKSKTKLRKKKGAMTDTTSFSMTSSANFRTEGLTLLDDRYEQLARQFEEDSEEEEYEEFKMENERVDFEDMLDDFLDNYELESGGRKVVRKDEEKKRLQEAADSVSKGKTALRRKKEKGQAVNSNSLDMLGSTLSKLNIDRGIQR
ncbi:Low temperature viability protein [Scheffersomyces xylosifermentans]|uniref:Low temperature viability protein n=1 Tax=Scheffersomyces xylosifermentans TaxID=1304137 RepID=UPI00315D97A6